MVLKVVNATELRIGSSFLIDGETFTVKSMDISKTGKHGASKCRFEAVSIMTGKKKVMMCPGGDRFEIPMIDKRRAQVLSVHGENVSLMDSESFENFELPIPEELNDQVVDGVSVEYWDMEGVKLIKRVI